jgi:hypothetical protein
MSVFSTQSDSQFVAYGAAQVLSVSPTMRPSVLTFVEIPYTPSLLLGVQLPIAVVADHAFSEACEIGFNNYFEEMYQCSLSGECSFVERFYTWVDVEREMREQVITFHEKYGERLSWCAGFALGWLSALALVDRPLALQGVTFMSALVARLQGGATC